MNEGFDDVRNANGTAKKVDAFVRLMSGNIYNICPTKKVRVYEEDKVWMCEKLRMLRRQKYTEDTKYH